MSKDLDVNKLMNNVKALTIENEDYKAIKTVEAVDEAKVLEAIEAGEYSAEDLQKYLTVKEVVMLKLTDPAKVKK